MIWLGLGKASWSGFLVVELGAGLGAGDGCFLFQDFDVLFFGVVEVVFFCFWSR